MSRERGETGLCMLAQAWSLPGLVTRAVLFLYQLMKEEPSPVMKETGAESEYP